MAGNPNTNTITTLTVEDKVFYNRTLLMRFTPKLLFAKYGQKKPYRANEGRTVNFRKFNSLSTNLTPLTSGETPDGQALDISQITAQVKQFGGYVTISDLLDKTGIDPVITETVELIGEQGGQVVDLSVRDVVMAGTNVQYANNKVDADALVAADVITSDEILKAVRTLKRNNIPTYDGKHYIGFISPDVAYDLMKDPLWQDVSKYNGGMAILEGEIGRMWGVRFIETTHMPIENNATSVPIHSSLIFGKEAYGVVDIEGGVKPEVIIKRARGDSDDRSDPLNQRSTVGWKALFTGVRLQELAMVRIESGVTA